MDPTDIGLFRLAEQRLAWVDKRQQLLAQNVANANTPNYKARDVAPFSAALTQAGLTQTSPMHLSGASGVAAEAAAKSHERSPSGNTVSLEDQLGKVADMTSAQTLVLNLHRSYQSMLRTALGRAG